MAEQRYTLAEAAEILADPAAFCTARGHSPEPQLAYGDSFALEYRCRICGVEFEAIDRAESRGPIVGDWDMRTISGGVTIRHDIIRGWIEHGHAYEVKVLAVEARWPVKLRKADVTELIGVLRRMRVAMPDEDTEMPPGASLPSSTL